MPTQLGIINNALLMTGANTINTLSDSSREARVAAASYPTTLNDLISRHPWTFTLGQTRLAQLTQEPLFGFDHAYQLPVDPEVIRVIRKNNPTNDYQIYQDKLFTDDNEVEILYQFNPGEEAFPSYFARLVELENAKMFAFMLLQDETQAQIFERMAAQQMRAARNIDSQNDPPAGIDAAQFALTAVR